MSRRVMCSQIIIITIIIAIIIAFIFIIMIIMIMIMIISIIIIAFFCFFFLAAGPSSIKCAGQGNKPPYPSGGMGELLMFSC